MPRITSEQRSSNREQIVAAARRCFARQGFHNTSMPDIAAEAGLSTGAPYRYFTGKQELIVEVATRAFAAVFAPVLRIIEETETITIVDVVTAAVQSHLPTGSANSTHDREADEELLRCGVAAWAELLHNADLHEHAVNGFTRVTDDIAQALHRTHDTGQFTQVANDEANARVIVALLHGFMIQRVAFGLTDLEAGDPNTLAAITRSGTTSDKTL
ncbi:TetR/AcrR family transcriptional regulator [Paramicrobacterium fandaimingii]|uniref:TetR/AcrR family transcriptional regulator n=1 Tax=Paramicrobacterium fandaimingii TaxID=2708079 RepID=UPI001422A2E0|nr:TetR/AcrR family transcriptional regulator [Microbacterium fandaimingii]